MSLVGIELALAAVRFGDRKVLSKGHLAHFEWMDLSWH